ncbi:MAG: hypothetical protein JW991_01000 [Candidatus Pacebacteria bacterium]|nr:hypothetical protein [Candidatus Paceibacterota bacterium]
MNSEKLAGYLLLAVGLGVIVASAFSIYQVFTGLKTPPEVFSFEAPGITLPGQQNYQIRLPEGYELPERFSLSDPGEKSPPQELKLLPDEVVNGLVNMSIYLLLMGFLSSVGFKIAALGIKLVKEIKMVVSQDRIRALE